MNKKIIMISMVAVFVGWGAYANTVDIDANGNRLNSNPAVAANCTEPILGTYSGSTDFEAKWQANSIPLRWYSDDEQLTVQGAAGTCTYDSGLTVPSSQYQPTKRGYHFRGWRVRPQFDFATLAAGGTNALSNGLERWAITLNGTKDWCWHKVGTGNLSDGEECVDSSFSDIERHEWKVQYSTGTVYGAGYCSAKSGDSNSYTWNNDPSNWKSTYDVLENQSGTKQYCWCQATGWKPSSNNANGTIYGQTSITASSAWVFNGDRGSASACASNCAADCAFLALRSSAFRRALFTGSN